MSVAGTHSAAAVTVASGNVSVGLRANIDYPCSCPTSLTGTSAGELNGVYNNSPFDVTWPAGTSTSNSGTLSYLSGCVANIPTLASIDAASTSLTVSNVAYVFGASHQTTSVTITFGSSESTGPLDLIVGVGTITIDAAGPNPQIVIDGTDSVGELHLTPVTPMGTCLNNTQQGFEMSGPLVTLEP